jgi:hypothetical protein
MDNIFSPHNRPLVSNRLKLRTIIFLVIAIGMLCVMGYDVFLGEAVWWMPILGLIVGLGIGFGYGQLARGQWIEEEQHIAIQTDAIGIILIIAYIALGSVRDILLKDFLTGTAVLVVSLALASGILFGRFWGVHRSIMEVLRERRAQ